MANGLGLRALIVVLVAGACRGRELSPEPPGSPAAAPKPLHQAELDALFALEQRRREEIDFAKLPPSDVALGPDPYRVERVAAGLVGVLRGESLIVALDANAAETSRLPAPRAPSGLAVTAEDDVLVVGEAAPEIAHYRVHDGRLERMATIAVAALGMRDVAVAPDGRTAYVVEERSGRVLAIELERDRSRALRKLGERELGRCHGPVQVEAIADVIAVDCLLDHTIELYRPDGAMPGVIARIRHDGPLWSFALHLDPDGGVLLAAGGVEDHPLVREDGGFAYIDSFVYLYRLAPGSRQPARLAAINASELGVVTPKWVELHRDGDAVSVIAAGYASPRVVTLTWRGGFADPPDATTSDGLPGAAAAVDVDDRGTRVAANPLFDAWIVQRNGESRIVAATSTHPARSLSSRLGELLFFTTMMAPWNPSEGRSSRFTCETCHHEGYVDGRTHFTGRENESDKVYATTRPLYGLFNNRPHFSRALDRSTTQMVHSEFRVANRYSGRDPWFALSRADVPWLAHVAGAPATLPPQLLRESLMAFLADFTHRSNPAVLGRSQLTDLERAGAEAFRDRCASCHAPRLVADDPRTQVPFERWEALVLSPSGPIVWSDASYGKTSVRPYVHERGTRVPSLRRLYKKWPYFTTGAAKSLDEVLDRFASDRTRSYHANAPTGTPGLSAQDKQALRAFLDLL